MAQPDPDRAGSERDQRRHAGDSESTDSGIQDKSQSRGGARAPQQPDRDDASLAPESGEKPDAMDKPAS